MKKFLMTLVACLCTLGMCVGCSSDKGTNDDTNTVMNSNKGDSSVTDTMEELKDDIKDSADDVKDGMTGNNNNNAVPIF